MKWTEKQKQVIDSRNRNLLVSAAAGSGKTAVLVERIISMISEGPSPLNIDQLLVMTFTNAAASEMRERIGAAVEKKLKEDPGNEHLWLQAALIPQAQIMTIDSFCLDLIRNHYNTLDIDPAFRIGDEGELTLLKGDVMEQVLESCYEEADDGFIQFSEQFGSGKSDKAMEDVILQAWKFSQSHPWPDEWLLQCRQQMEAEAAGDLDSSVWMQFLLKDISLQMEELAAQAEEALEVAREENGPLVYEPMLMNDVSRLNKVKEAADTGSFETFYQAVNELTFDRLAAARSKDIDPDKKAFVSETRTRVKKAAEKCRDTYGSQSQEEAAKGIRNTKTVIGVLLDMVKRFDTAYTEAKRERNVLDFNDLEHLALKVLVERTEDVETTENGDAEKSEDVAEKTGNDILCPTAAARELSEQYEEILVDEYQDSNLVQETLICSISRERLGHPNVFMVGDVKQSIYRFRLARPELFMEKYDTYGREESSHQMIELQQNFRSRASVLTCINDIFYQIMTKNLGGIRYTRETALYPGAEFEETDKKSGIPVQLLAADTGSEAFKQLDEDTADYTARELEAKMIAEQIKSFADEKNGLYVWDKDQQSYRKACYKDMVILLRSMSGWSEVFVNVLMNEGIPAAAQTRTGYFATTEVETVLSLLSVIDNPMQDIPMAAVLRSPIIGMNDNEMAWMMAAYKRYTEKNQDRGVYAACKLWEECRGQEEIGDTVESNSERGTQERDHPDRVITDDGDEKQSESRNEKEHRITVGRVEVPAKTAHSIWKKLEKFADLTEELRRDARYLPVHELLYQIYQKTGYYDYVSSMPAGETRRANLDMLAEKAAAYASTSYRGLFHFVRYIEKLKKYDTDFGEASPGDEGNSVRIMSIHKSKGLEFPVVFLAGMGKKFNKQDAYGQLLLDADLGAAADEMDLNLRTKAPTLKKLAIKRRMELESMGEELRVLYVAMTRAKEVLVMTGTDRSLENKLEKWSKLTLTDGQIPYTILSSASSFLDWLLMARSAIPEGHMEVREVRLDQLVGQELKRQLEKKNAKEELLNLDTGQVYDEEMKRQLDGALNYVYPYMDDTKLYTQMSVSELKKQSQIGLKEEEIGTERGELFGIENGQDGKRELLTETQKDISQSEEAENQIGGVETGKKQKKSEKKGAFRGTAYHRALECLNLTSVTDQRMLESHLSDLYQKGFLTEEAYEAIFSWDIWKFLESPLGRKMALAEKEGRLYRERQFMIGIPASEMKNGHKSEELVLIQGVIDAYIEEEDGFILIDYKTDHVPKEEEAGEKLLKERYQVQLDYYARALTQLTGKKVKEKWIYSFGLRKEIRLK